MQALHRSARNDIRADLVTQVVNIVTGVDIKTSFIQRLLVAVLLHNLDVAEIGLRLILRG